MRNMIYRKCLVFIIVFVLISFGTKLGISFNSSVFMDNFNDGDISDWTITTSGNGIFETSTTKYVSSPYSTHMKSLNQYDQAMAVSPSYSLDISEDYEISFHFLIPSTNNHWFEVFNNHQTYLIIDSNTHLKWYDGTSPHSIMSLNINQWYHIEMEIQPSSETYDIYINSQYKTTCDIWLHTGFEYSFRIGDRNNDQGSYFDYGEAYWDDFEISQTLNNPPNIPITPDGPTDGFRYTSYEYSTNATDPDGDLMFYLWDWDDGSSPDWYGPYSSGETCTQSHIWTNLGAYDIRVKAKDQYNEESGWSNPTILTISNVPPIAEPDGPYYAECHEPINLDGSGSDDPDGEIIEYLWTLGDGNTATGPYPTHTYNVDDVYTLSLTVTDDNGDSDTKTTTATIIDPEVDVDANGPYTGETGTIIQFTGSASGGTLPYSWYWDFKDGNTSSEQNPNHIYQLPGEYDVMLTVTDSLGGIGWDTTKVNINPGPLMVDAGGPYTGTINTPVQFTSTITGGYTPYTLDWDFGDNTSHSNEFNPIHQYTQVGTYIVTLSVEDDTGNTMSDTATVNVLESMPDLECEQALNWNEVKPGITVDGVIIVKNDGEPKSKLNWEVSNYPEWGTWTFTPSEGTGLTPEDEMLNVVVTLVTPEIKSISSMYKFYKIKSEDFLGNITIVNKDNASDIEVMPVSITVSKSKAFFILDFYRNFIFCFPLLNKILNQIII